MTKECLNPKGPIVIWTNYGSEGWQPDSYSSLAEALATGCVSANDVVTVRLDIAKHVLEPETTYIAPAPKAQEP